MGKRIKRNLVVLTSRADVEATVGELAMLELNREAMVNSMEQRLKMVREEYEVELARINGLIQEKFPSLQQWADTHPDEFGKRKSLELLHGTIGYRTGQFQCKPLPGWTWDKVIAWLLNKSLGYTVTKVNVDKEKLIADRETLTEQGLADRGVRVFQEEAFFLEPKRESIPEAAI